MGRRTAWLPVVSAGRSRLAAPARLAGARLAFATASTRHGRRAAGLARTRARAAAAAFGGRGPLAGGLGAALLALARALAVSGTRPIAGGMPIGQAAAEHEAGSVRIGRIGFERRAPCRPAAGELASPADLGAVHAIAFQCA